MDVNTIRSVSYFDNEIVEINDSKMVKCSNRFEPGFYHISWLEYPENKVEIKVLPSFEKIREMSFEGKQTVDDMMDAFLSEDMKNIINKAGFLHKFGVLLHGTQGTGKSSIIKGYCQLAIREANAIVFYINKEQRLNKIWDCIRKIRAIQSEPIIIVLEEIECHKDNFPLLKTIMDGPHSIDNCLFFGTTNVFTELPMSIAERESRFKYCLEIKGVTDEKFITDTIVSIVGADNISLKELDTLGKEFKGKTIDEIKHFCIGKLTGIKGYFKARKPIGFKI